MAINCYVKTGITGQTITATTTDFNTGTESSTFSCPEIGTSGRYKGVITTIADGSYYVDFFIGSSIIDSGFFSCIGNVEITSATINSKTSLLPSDPASNTQVNTRMATFAYTAPDNTGIAAIQSKTDQLIFTGANLNANAQVVSDKTGYSVSGLSANVITAASINAAALNGKGDWNIGKTGYNVSSINAAVITSAVAPNLDVASSTLATTAALSAVATTVNTIPRPIKKPIEAPTTIPWNVIALLMTL